MKTDEQALPPDVTPPRWIVHLEDAAILLSIACLWPAIGGIGHPLLARVLLGLALVAMVVVFVRRKHRVDRVFTELRRRQREQEAMGGYPMLPGMIPPERMRPPERGEATQHLGSNGGQRR